MSLHLLAMSLGIIAASLLPVLPSVSQIVCMAAAAVIGVVIRLKRPSWYCLSVISFVLAGVAWGAIYGIVTLQATLPVVLEGKDILLTGIVDSLPQQSIRKGQLVQKFELQVTDARVPGFDVLLPDGFDRVLLSWYLPSLPKVHTDSNKEQRTDSRSEPVSHEVYAGQTWQFLVRLKRPRGFVNPGGQDYQLWLMRQGVDAAGYIKDHQKNKLMPAAQQISFASLRQTVRKRLQKVQGELRNLGILTALVIGDQQNISTQEWRRMNKTGTSHLIVVSGLHIVLVAAACYWLGNIAARTLVVPLLWLPAQSYGALVSLFGAVFYSGLAGLSLPTQRACLMVLVAVTAVLLERQISPFRLLIIALAGVLLLDPWAAHSLGFWLSFGAVAVLLYSFAPRVDVGAGAGNSRGLHERLQNWSKPQWVVFIGLLPVFACTVGQVPLLSPLANCVAIPVVSFLVVPPALLGSLLLALPASYGGRLPGEYLVIAADRVLDYLWQALDWLIISLPNTMMSLAAPNALALLFSVLGVVILLAPAGLPARTLGLIFFLPLVMSDRTFGAQTLLQLTVLDVGQGLAIIARTRHHTLVYDSGPEYSEKFNAGSGIIAPALRAQAVSRIDKLVVSHGDADHAGGVAGLLAELQADELIAGEPGRTRTEQPQQPCHAPMRWEWDEVQFELLHPEQGKADREIKANNRSCVMQITVAGRRVLLPGDIEQHVEWGLIRRYGESLQADILVAPHHGSRTSSSTRFIGAVAPEYVVFSAGYLSQFHHPHADVQRRYTVSGSKTLNTAYSGAVGFTVTREGHIIGPVEQRDLENHYWLQ